MTQMSHLLIHDGPVNSEKVSEAASTIASIIHYIDTGYATLSGDSVVSVERPGGRPDIMLQRNWQVADVIRLNVWEHQTRLLFNLAIKNCTGHPLHKDPRPEQLIAHDRQILQTVLPYFENLRPYNDPVMNDVDARVAGISAVYPNADMIISPSVFNNLGHLKRVSSATSEIHYEDDTSSDLLWRDIPRTAVLEFNETHSGLHITVYPYKVMCGPMDPIERMRLIATMPPGSYEASKDDLK